MSLRDVSIDKSTYISGEGFDDYFDVDVEIDADDINYWFDMQHSDEATDFLKELLAEYEPDYIKSHKEYLDDTLKNELWESVRDKFSLDQLEKMFGVK